MLNLFLEKFVYPAPKPTYTAQDLPGHLCWLPWNESIPMPTMHVPDCSKGPPSCPPQDSKAPLGPGNCPAPHCGPHCGPPRCHTYQQEAVRALPCLWIPAKRSANVVMYFHANAEDLGVVHYALVHLQKQLQVSVLAIEYPGYGLLKDLKPSEETICNAAMVALRYIVSDIGVPYSQVMLLGRSLGCSPAIFLASRFPVGGLLLVNAFTSLAKVGEIFVGKALSQMAFGNAWNNEDSIGNVSCSVLFIHAARDRTVPVQHSATLFQKCRSRKLLITPENMEHNSHLFADPAFLAVPAIHFFHFPCYQTDNPPALPSQVFRPPVTLPMVVQNIWACSGPLCTTKLSREQREDEVAVPADAAVLGHIDVTDKLQSASGSRQSSPSRSRNSNKGMELLPKMSSLSNEEGRESTSFIEAEATFLMNLQDEVQDETTPPSWPAAADDEVHPQLHPRALTR